MFSNGFLSPDVDLVDLAKRTKNYSGAEIEGLVKSATSFSLGEKIDPENVMKPRDPTAVAIEKKHFEGALHEVYFCIFYFVLTVIRSSPHLVYQITNLSSAFQTE